MIPFSNLKLTHQNPGATQPLVLPIDVVCNTPDDELLAHIKENAQRKDWVMPAEAHEVTAILCGSGPSLADNLDKVRELANKGGLIFALNGAAKYLNDNGIKANYQIIIDAQEKTADLVGPAFNHLFASQVHPKLFLLRPKAEVWHIDIEGIEAVLPERGHDFSFIGGSASCGNTALCLLYYMGYRHFEIFGYDSSNKGDDSHAFRQPMNDGEPMAHVTFGGKEYLTSFTMKLQAEKFKPITKELTKLGCTFAVHGYGLLPDMWNATEQQKYETMWGYDEYREVAPGENCVDEFVKQVNFNKTVIDFGCGTGRAGIALDRAGFNVLLIDFTENSRDESAKSLDFMRHDFTEPLTVKATYGFCTDVMEHIPPEKVRIVLSNIMSSVEYCFFQISTEPDNMGALIGDDLHLTVKLADWWYLELEQHAEIIWMEIDSISVKFYVRKK